MNTPTQMKMSSAIRRSQTSSNRHVLLAACGSTGSVGTCLLAIYRGADPNGSNVPCCMVNEWSFDANATSFKVR